MADTPDISKVISLLMENPELISQISSLVKKNDDSEENAETVNTPVPEITESEEPEIQVSIPPVESPPPRRKNRTQLLYAMKPYLKESRAKAIDTMVSIVDILDMMTGR